MAELIKRGKYTATISEIDVSDGTSDVVVQPPMHIGKRFVEFGLNKFRSGQEPYEGETIAMFVVEHVSTSEGTVFSFQSDSIMGGDLNSEQGMEHFKAVAGEMLRFANLTSNPQSIDNF